MLTVTAEVARQVENITLEALYKKYPEGLVFGPIVVTRETDYIDGEKYLQIRVIFDGDHKRLDPKWNLFRQIEPGLLEIGLDGLPNWSYCEKSEWEAGPPPD